MLFEIAALFIATGLAFYALAVTRKGFRIPLLFCAMAVLSPTGALILSEGLLVPSGLNHSIMENTTEFGFEPPTNITAGNGFVNVTYGEMWYHNHSASSVNFATQYKFYNMSMEHHKMNGFYNSSANTLNVLFTGEYAVDYHAIGSGQNNHEYVAGVGVNGEILNKTATHKKMAAGGDYVTMSGTGIINLTAGDVVTLMVADFSGTGTGNYLGSNLNLIKTDNFSVTIVSGGGGGVSGSGTDNRIVRWDGTDDIQDSGWEINDDNHLVYKGANPANITGGSDAGDDLILTSNSDEALSRISIIGGGGILLSAEIDYGIGMQEQGVTFATFKPDAIVYTTDATTTSSISIDADTITTGTTLRIDASSLTGTGKYVDFDSDFVVKNEGITGIGHSTPTEMLTVKSNGTIGVANFSDASTTSSWNWDTTAWQTYSSGSLASPYSFEQMMTDHDMHSMTYPPNRHVLAPGTPRTGWSFTPGEEQTVYTKWLVPTDYDINQEGRIWLDYFLSAEGSPGLTVTWLVEANVTMECDDVSAPPWSNASIIIDTVTGTNFHHETVDMGPIFTPGILQHGQTVDIKITRLPDIEEYVDFVYLTSARVYKREWAQGQQAML